MNIKSDQIISKFYFIYYIILAIFRYISKFIKLEWWNHQKILLLILWRKKLKYTEINTAIKQSLMKSVISVF